MIVARARVKTQLENNTKAPATELINLLFYSPKLGRQMEKCEATGESWLVIVNRDREQSCFILAETDAPL